MQTVWQWYPRLEDHASPALKPLIHASWLAAQALLDIAFKEEKAQVFGKHPWLTLKL